MPSRVPQFRWRQDPETFAWDVMQVSRVGPFPEQFVWFDERSVPFEIRPWRRFLETVPINSRTGKQDPDVVSGAERFWVNSHYLVFIRTMGTDDDGEVNAVHLSLRTVENDTRHDWRDMQRIKNELCGPEWEAVELYPKESRVVDMANQFHLWAIRDEFPFGFPQGMKLGPDEEHDLKSPGAQQRPFTSITYHEDGSVIS